MSDFFNMFNSYVLQPILGFGQQTPEENIPQKSNDNSGKRKRSESDTSETENTENIQESQNKRLKVDDNRFQELLRCKTTSWQNNCSLNCLTHFLFSKLENNQLQHLFLNNQNYQAVLQTFQEYYTLPVLPAWDDIKNLLVALEVPHDREAVFAPVLRKFLGRFMVAQAQDFWDIEAAPAFSEYLSTGEINDIATPIFLANRDFFTELKIQYDAAFATIKTEPVTEDEELIAVSQIQENKKEFTEKNLQDQINFNRQNKIEVFYREMAKSYWIEGVGHKNYIDYITDVHNAQMISADQLQLLCQHLDIKAEVYTQDGVQNTPEGNFTWTLTVYNSGVHWEYEEPDASVEKKDIHNQYYPMEFYGTEPVFGKFKTYAHPEDDQVKKIKDIKAYVALEMHALKNPVDDVLVINQSVPTVTFSITENINHVNRNVSVESTSLKQKNLFLG